MKRIETLQITSRKSSISKWLLVLVALAAILMTQGCVTGTIALDAKICARKTFGERDGDHDASTQDIELTIEASIPIVIEDGR